MRASKPLLTTTRSTQPEGFGLRIFSGVSVKLQSLKNCEQSDQIRENELSNGSQFEVISPNKIDFELGLEEAHQEQSILSKAHPPQELSKVQSEGRLLTVKRCDTFASQTEQVKTGGEEGEEDDLRTAREIATHVATAEDK